MGQVHAQGFPDLPPLVRLLGSEHSCQWRYAHAEVILFGFKLAPLQQRATRTWLAVGAISALAVAVRTIDRDGLEYECSTEDGIYLAVAKHNPLTGQLRTYVGEDHNGFPFTVDTRNSSRFDCVERRAAEAARQKAEQEEKERCAAEVAAHDAAGSTSNVPWCAIK